MCVNRPVDINSCFPVPLLPAGVVSWDSEPQPKAWPDGPGPGAGLLPGDRPAESARHPLQKRVREEKHAEGQKENHAGK